MMRFFAVLIVVLGSTPSFALVDIVQAANPYDRSFERLPDLRAVRGATPRALVLDVNAEPNENWSLVINADFLLPSTTGGIGPRRVEVAFDGARLAMLDDPSATIVVIGSVNPAGNRRSLDVRIDTWPSLSAAATPAELRAYAANPDHWPRDGFGGAWELWGFVPDGSTHPEQTITPINVAERTACAAGTTGPGCTREGQAGLTAGIKADQAWLLSTGDPRIVIGELDSGIRWDSRDLQEKFYINVGELRACPPPSADGDDFDVNRDGFVSMRDYDRASWLTDVNRNGFRDPQDLIWGNDGDGPCSDGIDDDDNGYTDDISGWDFFWNDNDPSDDGDFGHGTGEARDSTAEAHANGGSPGVCPRCLVMPVRVGDSFIVDVNQFAEGTLFVVASGAHIVQEALGTLNNTPFAQAAIDFAYQNNVPIIASAADETSYHHNFPGAGEHTLYVHAIVHDGDDEFQSTTYLNFNNCTNFGGHLMLSTPGEGCSSEATGKTAGQAGLVLSYFQQLQDQANRSGSEDDRRFFATGMMAEELYQVLTASAEDIDVDGAETDDAAKALQKYPSNEGWDLHFGYGRNDARKSLELLRDQRIPPAVNVSIPTWFEVFDPDRQSSFAVHAELSSPRLNNLRWRLSISNNVLGTALVPVAEGTLSDGESFAGKLADVSLRDDGPLAALVAGAAAPVNGDAEQFSGTIVVELFGDNRRGETITGRFRKTFAVRADPDVRDGFPIYLGASGESSGKMTDLDGDGLQEFVTATSDGVVHAIGPTGDELPGYPVRVGVLRSLSVDCDAQGRGPRCHRNSSLFRSGLVNADDIRQSITASAAIGDLNGDGSPGRDVVVATLDGAIYAFDAYGAALSGFPVGVDDDRLADGNQRARTCERDGELVIGCRSEQFLGERGVFASPVLVDLNRDGDLEIVVAGLDAWLYAWHHDGSEVNGWPVHLVHPTSPAILPSGELNRLEDRIIGTPTVANLFGDGVPIVAVGTTERLLNAATSYLYGVWPDGNAHEDGAFVPGWPVSLDGFISLEILPFVGRGNPNSPAAGDIDDDGDDEVVAAGLGGVVRVVQADGNTDRSMASSSEFFGSNATTDEVLVLPMVNNPTIADLDGDGRLDVINGTIGSGITESSLNGGRRGRFDHSVSAWIGNNGYFLPGFPKRVADYQFFMNYAVADLEGDGQWNVISGDGGYFVYAPNVDGSEAPGFPKFTQGWHVTTPAIGDIDSDERIDIAAQTREGWLWMWETSGHVGGPADQSLPAIQWAGFHRDDQNTGNASDRFADLTEYPRLSSPDDGCEGACCCSARAAANDRGLWPAVLAFAASAVILNRRRPRADQGAR